MARSISFDVLANDKAGKNIEELSAKVAALGKQVENAGGKIKVELGKRKLDQQVAELNAEVAKLNKKKIRIDADISQAKRELSILEAEAKTATGERKVKVDADITRAREKLRELEAKKIAIDLDIGAALAKVRVLESSLDGAQRKAHIRVSADTAGTLAKIAAIGAALAAALPAAIALVGALAGLGAVVGAGIGVGILAFKGLGDAVSALGQKSQGAGESAKAMADRIRSATQAVTRAREDLARANENVQLSEADLARAQQDAKRAQDALNGARQDAIRMLQDYQTRTEDMALTQQRAALSVDEAQARLNQVMSDGASTDLEKRDAALSLAEAQQRQKDLAIEAQRLAEDKAAADAKGVAGSDQVVSAMDRIDSANQRVQDAERNLQHAQQDRVHAVEALAEANRKLVEAQQPLGGGGVDKVAEAMGKLGPKAQEFAKFMRGFIDGPLKELRQTGQEAFLPGIESGLKRLEPIMKASEPAVKAFSATLGTALGDLIPIFGSMMKPFLTFATSALKGLAPLQGVMVQFADEMGKVFEQLSKSGQLDKAMGAFVKLLGALLMILPPLIDGSVRLMAAIGPNMAKSVEIVGKGLIGLINFMADHPKVFAVFAASLAAVSAIMAVIASPAIAIAVAISAVIAALAWFFTSTKAGVAIVHTLWSWLKQLGEGIKQWFSGGVGAKGVDQLRDAFQRIKDALAQLMPVFQQIGDWIVRTFTELRPKLVAAWDAIYQAFTTAIEAISVVIKLALEIIIGLWNIFGSTILSILGHVFGALLDVIKGAFTIIRGVYEVFIGIFTGDWSRAWEGIKTIFSGLWQVIIGLLRGAFGVMLDIGKLALSGLAAFFTTTWDGIVSFFGGVKSRIAAIAHGLWDGIKAAFRAVINWIIDAWNSLRFTIPPVSIPGIGQVMGSVSIGVPAIPRLARGGIATQPTLAMIGEGRQPEAVLPLSRLREFVGGGRPTIVMNIHNVVAGERPDIVRFFSGVIKEAVSRGEMDSTVLTVGR